MKATRTISTLSFAYFLCAMHAGATTIPSTSYSGWYSTVTGYADVSMPSTGSYNTSAGVSLSNSSQPSAKFVFTGPDNGNFSLTGGLYTTGGHNYPSLFGSSDGKGEIMITMPSGGENAVLLNLATTGGTVLDVQLSDGESFTPAAGVLGLSISHDITWLTISTGSGSEPIIDDFMFGNSNLTQDQFTQDPAPTLEASTIAMIGGGLLILFGGRRKLFGGPLE